MDLRNLDSSEQETAVQLFRQGLKSLAADLADANTRYRAAQATFKAIEADRRQVAERYNTIISLIVKAGGEVDDKEANLANVEADLAIKQDDIEHKQETSKDDGGISVSTSANKARPIIRNEVIEILRATNKFLTGNEVLSLVRKKFGEQIPDSTVTSALSVQNHAGLLKRYSAANGTSLYGLPEWFSDGKPKQEHSDSNQMLIMS
jgi:chromosome segregation ATPase